MTGPQALGPRRFRPDIQGLRAVAVLLVVLYHAEIPGVTGGYVGVDVFFVISGFLITGQMLREVRSTGRISLTRFWIGRVRRLLPAAAIVTVVTLLAARIWESLFQVAGVAKDAMATAIYGINYRLAAEGINYQQASDTPSPLQHYWSLSVEEQFYLAWPLIILLVVFVFRSRWTKMLPVILILGTAASLVSSQHLLSTNGPMAYFSIQSRAWELGIGAIIAMAAQRLSTMRRWVAVLLSWTGVALIIGCGFYFKDSTPFPGVGAVAPVGGAALMIMAGCGPVAVGAERWLLRWRPMQWIGKISYAWYLWHWPLLILAPIASGYTFGWVLNLQLVILALWLAAVTYLVVEWGTQRAPLHKPKWAIRGAGLSGVTLASAAVVLATLPALVTSGKAVAAVKSADSSQLQSVIGASLGTIAAPSNLSPSLASASSDVPASSANGCHADFLVVAQPACVYGDPKGVATVVLVGDSHAQQWLPALDREAKAKRWKVVAWTKAACSLADLRLNNDSLHREFSECDEWRVRTIGRIKLLHPQAVLVSQSDNVPGRQYTDTQWADATAKAVSELVRLGLQVTYMLDTPLPFMSAPDCVAKHPDNVTKCIRPRTSVDSVYGYPGRHAAVSSTLLAAGVPTLEPVNWLCTTTACPVVVGNLLVYRDESHISATYSRFLAPMLAPVLVAR